MAYVHTIRATIRGIRSYVATRNEQIGKLRAKGWSRNELAERYRITPQRVGQILSALEKANRKSSKRKAS